MISVVIPVYNAERTLSACLKSLFASDFHDYEVIVVDDCSTDNSTEIAGEFDLRVVRMEDNRGPGPARNKGAEHANGSVIAFVDADCEVPANWLARIDHLLRTNNDVAAVTGPYSDSVGKEFLCLFQHYDILFFQRNAPRFVSTCTSSNLTCRKDVFFEVGGFPSIRVNEDMEFASKLAKKHKIYWFKDNGVAHNYRSDFKAYYKQQVSWAASVVNSYLSKPAMMFETANFSRSNIVLQLLLTGIFCLSVPAAFFNVYFAAFSVAALLALLIVNADFFRYFGERTNARFLAFCRVFVLVRNAIWVYGLFLGCVTFFLRRERSY